MKTYLPKVVLNERKWHVIDANGAVLGRLAAQVADVLRGKNKPVFTPHLDAGDFVVVINAEKVVLTGKKETDKKFMTYSGWKGGGRYRAVAEIRQQQPGKIVVNGRPFDNYFPSESLRAQATQPLARTETASKFDVHVNVRGGGPSGQAGAVRHGIARALLQADGNLRPTLKADGLLTRDPRMRERKKYGQPGARKRFQYSKR